MIKILTLALSTICALGLSAQTNGWRLFGELRQSRSHFFATQISPSEILVVGGYSRGSALSSCEIINTETGVVTEAEPMRYGRWLFAPVVVGDSLLFIFGGAASNGLTPVPKIEVFNFRTRRWSDAGDLERSRAQIVAAFDGVNSIIVVGGRIGNEVVDDANVYYVDRRYSDTLHAFPYRTSLGTAIQGPNGEPLFFGGRSGGPGSFRSRRIHTFDPSTGRFRDWGAQADSVYVALATKLASGAVVVSGGSVVERESNANTLVSTVSVLQQNEAARVVGSLTQPRILHHAVELQPNKILIAGGESPSSSQLNSCELAVVDSAIVRPFYPLNVARSWYQLVAVRTRTSTRVFAIGGRVGGLLSPQTTPSIELLEDGCTSTFASVLSTELAYVGDARTQDGSTSLTRLSRFSTGSIWKPYVGSPTRDGFHHRIKARLANGDNNNDPERTSPGADGIVLVVQRSGVDALGEPGRGIGYSGIKNGVAVEFDTYVNHSNADPSEHHLAVMRPVADTLTAIHSTASTVASTINIPAIVSDSTPFYIDYHYLDKKLTVTITKDSSFDRHSLVVENLNIDSLIRLAPGQPYFIGFTSATGIAVQDHIIDEWTEFSCLVPLNTTSVHEPTPGYPISIPHIHTLVVQPSPASSSATVHLPIDKGAPTTLVVYDMQGRDVLRLDLVDGASTVNLAVDHLAAGMYVVHVHTAANILTGLLPVSR